MGNDLFRRAREAVAIAEQSVNGQANLNSQEAISIAKNELSSAFANSTIAEKEQLHKMQDQLDQLQSH